MGQGLRPRRDVAERRPGEEPGLRPLRPTGRSSVKCLDGGKLMRPAGGPGAEVRRRSPTGTRACPGSASAATAALWLLVRHHPLPGGQGEVWVGSALALDGQDWSAPRRLSNSANLIDNRPALAPLGDGLLAVYSTDHRQNANNRDRGRPLRRPARRDLDRPTAALAEAGRRTARPAASVETVHPDEPADIARMPRAPGRGRRQAAPAAARRVPPPHRGQLAQRPGRPARRRLALRPRRRRPRLDGQRRPRQRLRLRIPLVADPEDAPTCTTTRRGSSPRRPTSGASSTPTATAT